MLVIVSMQRSEHSFGNLFNLSGNGITIEKKIQERDVPQCLCLLLRLSTLFGRVREFIVLFYSI